MCAERYTLLAYWVAEMSKVQKFVDEFILLFSVDAFSYADYLEASLEMEYIANETEAKMMADGEYFLRQLRHAHIKTRRTRMLKQELFGTLALLRWIVDQFIKIAGRIIVLALTLWLIGLLFPIVAHSVGLPYTSFYEFVLAVFHFLGNVYSNLQTTNSVR